MMQHTIEVPAEWSSIATLMAFTDQIEADLGLTADQSYLLRLVIEEIATNIIKYGYCEQGCGRIELQCCYEQDTLRITIRDHGTPFDPRDHPDPDISTDVVDERQVGGLGLYFVREFADQISYHHDETSGWNELIVIKGP
ncbi:ATP-binding protein [Candidatus Oscillochloris fontis]|uniref:ATP-binding protein n=1 Tax=Candidatus Oscillochloris fontis TaxID=2496868 RepID=UPI00101DCBC4|nr:ATP-binding protein [Candidatus Oscillochloris fontis]